jgi:diguanylate cyclase (GGDEF)-like protein
VRLITLLSGFLRDAAMRAPKILIRTKFALPLIVLISALAAVGLVANHGLARVNDQAQRLYTVNVQILRLSTELGDNFDRTASLALRLIPTNGKAERARLEVKLDEEIVRVNQSFAALRRAPGQGEAERGRVDRLAMGWQRFLALRRSGSLDATGFSRAHILANGRLADRVSAIFDRLAAIMSRHQDAEVGEADEASARAHQTYRESRLLLLIIVLIALAAGGASLLLLVRNVVPRIRSYANFAAAISGGDLTKRLGPRGHDEIADLGRALDSMVARRQQEDEQAAAQTEFTLLTQVAQAEEEAYELLRRQLERSAPGSSAVLLNRNNSADRLEPMTTISSESLLAERLADAEPRSCLAIRFGQTHREGSDRKPLVSCEVCGEHGFSTCEPLLVGGEVIGAALVQHPEPLAEREYAAVTASVSQAAPVLGNLRNLALAEVRAATDALTGLPNSRDARDTLKRMIAQASRSVTPLAALLLDLDHFKQVNDSFGHARGDDVLAAVGAVLRSALRESDFVARYGGEEFLILLPDTGREEALLVAEKVRAEIETITVAGVSHEITASLGLAVLPDDAGEGASLLRYADRALYAAKAHGRNRVEAAEPAPPVSAEV